MMKKTLIVFIFILSCTQFYAQDIYKVATINSKELFEFVPGKKEATKEIEELNKSYKNELSLMQNDYNNKYTDFLANQNNLAESIKLRRMQELYELEQNINRFIRISQEDIETQEQLKIEPLRDILKKAINDVGVEQQYTCIYDMANPSISFVTPQAIDANPFVKAKLQRR